MSEDALRGLENVEKLVGQFGHDGFSVRHHLSLFDLVASLFELRF